MLSSQAYHPAICASSPTVDVPHRDGTISSSAHAGGEGINTAAAPDAREGEAVKAAAAAAAHESRENQQALEVATNATAENESLPPHHHQHHRQHSQQQQSAHQGQESKDSAHSGRHEQSHEEYIASLKVPDHEMTTHIAEVQEQKEVEILARRLEDEGIVTTVNGEGEVAASSKDGKLKELDDKERERAANLIQRNYRGHRERRMLAGMSLDPSSRWVEAVKEARYRQLTLPRARADSLSPNGINGEAPTDGRPSGERRTSSNAMQNWRKVGMITRRAGGDEDSDEEASEEEERANMTPEEKEALRRKQHEKKLVRQKAAKMMDLQYFLEMVDGKHRYGSNLRTYHETWKASDTNENFFYWLDYGEGRYIDNAACPRERLEREQVRYLNREERLQYLVKIDKEGRLCWAKNGARIDTTQKYKDSIHGIVPETDETPAYTAPSAEAARPTHRRTKSSTTSTSTSSSSDSEAEDERANKYATPEFDNAKGIKKIRHVSAATIFNQLLRGSVKKNTWIFVADTSFRLYVGIKQSGAFQHSSFLHGSRISAAGTLKIKNGRLSKLSPLSGHYRPPVSNFNAFVHSIKEEGVDMSHVSISRSYAVLVGLEAYVKTRRKGKKIMKKFIYHRDKLLSPQEVAEKEEAERDKTESAAREKRFLELKEKAELEERQAMSTTERIKDKLHISKSHSHKPVEVGETKSWEKDPDIQHPGTGPENAIAPTGKRE